MPKPRFARAAWPLPQSGWSHFDFLPASLCALDASVLIHRTSRNGQFLEVLSKVLLRTDRYRRGLHYSIGVY